MTKLEFITALEELGYHTQELYDNRLNNTEIFIKCVKDRRLLAVVYPNTPYHFEITSEAAQEFWYENERADELIALIVKYTRTEPRN